MKRLMDMNQCPAQRAQGVAQQARPTGATGVQASDFVVVTNSHGDADHVGVRDPVAASYGGIADDPNAICSIFVNRISMDDNSAVSLAKYNASTTDGAGWSRFDGHDVAVADGGVHAGPAGADRDGRSLPEKRGDDFLDFGHDDGGLRTEKV